MLKPILPSSKTMTMRSRSLAELTQLIGQAVTLSRASGLSGFVKIHVRTWCAGRSRTTLSLRSHETLERELLAWSWGLFGVLAPPVFWNTAYVIY
jgi:hypothetical protein